MIKIHHKYGLLFFFLLVFIKGFTQESVPSFGLKETFHFGSILPHRSEVNEIIEGHSFAYELSFYKATTGKKEWQQLYKYPKVGISVLYMDLGNKKEIGSGFGVFPFIEIPLNQQKINWRLKMGYGLGYIEKPFDKTTNYKNIAIGSHFNALIYANMLWSVKITEGFDISSGLSIIHYSNSSFARPNLGINIASVNAGLTYSFGAKNELITNKIEDRPRNWKKQLMVGFGLKEIPPVEGPKYFVNTYSFNMLKARSNKSSFGFGADLFYNSSLSDLIIVEDPTATQTSLDNFRAGLVGIYGFDFGKISLYIEMGGYLFNKYTELGSIYNRLTTRFYVTDKLFLNAGLKTHFVVADFAEVGIGYNFK